MQVTIRRATSDDARAVSDLYLRARHSAAAARTIPPPAHEDDDISNWIEQVVIPTRECWVAERSSGAVVGVLLLGAEWIDQLYVDPELTRAGIGTELMTAAKRERPEGLRLWTFVSNQGAQRFYLRHGFREIERTDGSDNEERAPAIQYAWLPAGPVSTT